MIKLLSITSIAIAITFNNIAQNLISVTLLSSHNKNNIETILNNYGWSYDPAKLNSVKSYKVKYNTTDVNGNSTIASGAVYIPDMTNCNFTPITVYEHGTEFRKNNVPSKNKYVGHGLYFSTTGYITVMPDYLGLGDNLGIHLYQHAKTEATATLDLIKAVRTYLDTTTSTNLQDNGEIFITGYSQGGHAAMATLKYIKDNSLENEFNVVACAPLSGAYDQTGAQFDLIFDGDSNYYATPFLPYILASYQEAYGNIYQNYDEIYKPTHSSQIENYINSGTYNGLQWALMLGSNYYNFMQDSVLQNILSDTYRNSHPINVALRKNNLYNWVPNTPLRMVYCGSDSMVSPQNSTNTLDTMLSLGATDVQALNVLQSGDHNSCFIPATSYALNWFDSLANKCSNYLSSEHSISENNSYIYPNPASNFITLKGLEKNNNTIKIYSLLGKEILTTNFNKDKIDISNLPKGVYFLNISNNSRTRLKFIKQ